MPHSAKHAQQREEKEVKTSATRRVIFFQSWLPIIINALLLVVVIAQAAYAYLQWNEMKRAERAWMVVVATGFKITADRHAQGIIKVQNAGQGAPAIDVHVWRCAEVREQEPTITEKNPGDLGCFEAQIGVAGRDVPIPMMTSDPKYVVQLEGIPAPFRFYYWGRITYHTIPESGERHTTFCLLNAGDQLGPCSDPKGNDGD